MSKVEFYKYLQPIMNSSFGVIKSDGYMTHIPGTVMTMSDDESMFAFIKIPVIEDMYLTSIISKYIGLKEIDENIDLNSTLYFSGWNVKRDRLINLYNIYSGIENKVRCLYYSPNCNTIPGFTEAVSTPNIMTMNVSDGMYNYRIPVSKSITSISKSDNVELRIYDCVYNPMNCNVKTVHYRIFKKKFKIFIDVFVNILMV